MTSVSDIQMMARAIRLAERGRYRTRPNPAVGCVLVRRGRVVGEGSTQRAGGNHAEVEALTMAGDARGCTAYVTLEPCAHYGRTGPCAEALIAAGVERVVVAGEDPNPEVGGGITRLREAGVRVDLGVLTEAAQAVNPGFFKRHLTGRPLVRLKLAASLDGRSAMASGESQWITGPDARADVQRLRGRSGAIVTGIETVLADDPALTVRDAALDIPGQPLRVVLDSRLRTPPAARLLAQPGSTLIVYTSDGHGDALRAAGAELHRLPASASGVDLVPLLALLAEREINEVLVECGPRLAGAFVEEGLVDELIVYMAPTLLGSNARPLLCLPLETMAQQRRLAVKDLRQVGDDYRWTLVPTNG
jgi:diaminohydroxyphosphoribosylaminopyrimidine deaminase/5-amino-6-(5-phosphoribosylamino)uracil reductase